MRSLLPFRRDRRRTRGQSIVEFAILLPVILVMLAGALDLGRVFYANISLNNAAREGALQASETPASFQKNQPCNVGTNLVVCRVQLEAKGSAVVIPDTNIDMTCSLSGCPKQAGSTVTVKVTGSFTLVTPLLSAIFGGQTIPMTSSATAQIQYLPDPLLITPPPAPVAAFTVSPSTGTVLTTFDFDASASTGDPTDYQWDFGDGAQVVGQTPTVSHTYALPGTYTAILTVVNLSGVDIAQRTITVTVLPGPSGSVAPTEEPSPSCAFIPNVVGLDVASAKADLINAGFVPLEFLLANGPKGRIQSQNPDHTECKAPGSSVQIWYRPN